MLHRLDLFTMKSFAPVEVFKESETKSIAVHTVVVSPDSRNVVILHDTAFTHVAFALPGDEKPTHVTRVSFDSFYTEKDVRLLF